MVPINNNLRKICDAFDLLYSLFFYYCASSRCVVCKKYKYRPSICHNSQRKWFESTISFLLPLLFSKMRAWIHIYIYESPSCGVNEKKKLEKVLWVPTGTLAVSKRMIATTTKITTTTRTIFQKSRQRTNGGTERHDEKILYEMWWLSKNFPPTNYCRQFYKVSWLSGWFSVILGKWLGTLAWGEMMGAGI